MAGIALYTTIAKTRIIHLTYMNCPPKVKKKIDLIPFDIHVVLDQDFASDLICLILPLQ